MKTNKLHIYIFLLLLTLMMVHCNCNSPSKQGPKPQPKQDKRPKNGSDGELHKKQVEDNWDQNLPNKVAQTFLEHQLEESQQILQVSKKYKEEAQRQQAAKLENIQKQQSMIDLFRQKIQELEELKNQQKTCFPEENLTEHQELQELINQKMQALASYEQRIKNLKTEVKETQELIDHLEVLANEVHEGIQIDQETVKLMDQLQQKLVELQNKDVPQHLILELKQLIQQKTEALQARTQQPFDEENVDLESVLERFNNSNRKRSLDSEWQVIVLHRIQEIELAVLQHELSQMEEENKRKTVEEMKRLEELKKEAEEDRLREARRDKEDEENAKRKKDREKSKI